jgi:invasion protein IalB
MTKLHRGVMAACLAGLMLQPLAAYAQSTTTTPAAPAADAQQPAAAGAQPAPADAARPATPATGAQPAAPATAPAAAAPAPVPDAVQAWAKFCDPDPKDQHKVCIVRKLVFQDNKQVATITFRIDSKKGVPTLLVAAVPLDIVLTRGLTWNIDKLKPVVTPFWHCTPQFCESEQLIKAPSLNRLKKAKTLTLTVRNLANKPFVINVSLDGFAKTYDMKDAPTYADYIKSLPTK